MKRVITAFLVALIILCSYSLPIQAVNTGIKYTYTFRSNILTLAGTHPAGEGHEITLLAVKDGVTTITKDDIVFVDQVTTGINGAFVFKMSFPTRLKHTIVKVKIGATNLPDGATTEPLLLEILDSAGTIEDVPNNALKIGKDVYEIGSSYFTDDNILDSLMNGGNKLAFKIGGLWYDLLDPYATSSSYLTPVNAVPAAIVSGWELGKWYKQGSASPVYFE